MISIDFLKRTYFSLYALNFVWVLILDISLMFNLSGKFVFF